MDNLINSHAIKEWTLVKLNDQRVSKRNFMIRKVTVFEKMGLIKAKSNKGGST